jgi:hypothetical protein
VPETRPKFRIALVGHCVPDSYALRSAIRRFIPEAEVVFARNDAALDAEVPRADLLLVNRILDGDFRDPAGIALIQRLHEAVPGRPRLMLVSNHADAQSRAEAAGAAPGFGKSSMHAEGTRERLRRALGLG